MQTQHLDVQQPYDNVLYVRSNRQTMTVQELEQLQVVPVGKQVIGIDWFGLSATGCCADTGVVYVNDVRWSFRVTMTDAQPGVVREVPDACGPPEPHYL